GAGGRVRTFRRRSVQEGCLRLLVLGVGERPPLVEFLEFHQFVGEAHGVRLPPRRAFPRRPPCRPALTHLVKCATPALTLQERTRIISAPSRNFPPGRPRRWGPAPAKPRCAHETSLPVYAGGSRRGRERDRRRD